MISSQRNLHTMLTIFSRTVFNGIDDLLLYLYFDMIFNCTQYAMCNVYLAWQFRVKMDWPDFHLKIEFISHFASLNIAITDQYCTTSIHYIRYDCIAYTLAGTWADKNQGIHVQLIRSTTIPNIRSEDAYFSLIFMCITLYSYNILLRKKI